MTDHELSPAQLEAATIQRKAIEDLIAAAEIAKVHDDRIGDTELTVGEWLRAYLGFATLDVDGYRAEHPEIGEVTP